MGTKVHTEKTRKTEKLSHVGLYWIQIVGNQVVTRKRQRKSWVGPMS